MRAAIITEGSRKIGFGHITRCLGLYAALEKRRIEPWFIINNDREAIEKLKQKNYKTYRAAQRLDQKILQLVRWFDVAIIDSYKLQRGTYLKIQQALRFLVCLDDNKRLNYPPGIVVNGSIGAGSLRYKKSSDVTYLLGPQFIPMRREFIRVSNKRIKDRVRDIMIIFGGSDFKRMTATVRDSVSNAMPKATLHIIAGRSAGNRREFRRRAGSPKGRPADSTIRYYYDLSPKDLKRLMLDCDVAISAGGQTLYELARTGTPTIGICVADNQVNNLEGFHRRGFLKYCGWYNSPDLFKKLEAAFEDIQDAAERKKMSDIGTKLLDGRGAERIADMIAEVTR